MHTPQDKILFPDARTVDYGDVPLDCFEELGCFRAYPGTVSRSALLERAKGSRIIITNKCIFDRGVFSRLPDLKLVALAATGTNNVDLKAAREHGVAVANVAGYSTESVVGLTWAFILALATNLTSYAAVTKRRWVHSPMFTLPLFTVTELRGKTLGIIGCGRIGRRVASIGRSFGMKVLAARLKGRDYSGDRTLRVPLDELAARSDIVSIHASLSEITRRIVDGPFLGRMKRGAFLVNMARGDLWDEQALFRYLVSGHLGGAATDVLSSEPPTPGHILLKAPNLLITPHIGWASLEARKRLVREIYLNVRAFQHGRRRNRVETPEMKK
jgi:glycerate dehydrogenase